MTADETFFPPLIGGKQKGAIKAMREAANTWSRKPGNGGKSWRASKKTEPVKKV